MEPLFSKLISLANPEMGFMQKIRVAEGAIAGYTFANGWVSCRFGPLPVSGCGGNKEQALHVMMLEAVERNSAVYAGNERLREGRAGEISAGEWRRWLPFSNQQLAKGRGVEDEEWVGESLGNKTAIRFVEGQDLASGKAKAIPAALVYLGYQGADEPRYAAADSTGCAAGETEEDAIFRGLMELAERDAFGIWWFNRTRRPGLGFESDSILGGIARGLQAEGRWLRLVDLTNDLEVPVVAALTGDEAGERIYIGCAAGVSETVAARKAALEATGFWFWGKVGADPASREKWLAEASLMTEDWLEASDARALSEDEKVRFGDSARLVERMTTVGAEPVAVRLTRSYFGIPVMRTMAPGLASQRRRFSPGRLYDVPVKLGWLETKRREEELARYPSPL